MTSSELRPFSAFHEIIADIVLTRMEGAVRRNFIPFRKSRRDAGKAREQADVAATAIVRMLNRNVYQTPLGFTERNVQSMVERHREEIVRKARTTAALDLEMLGTDLDLLLRHKQEIVARSAQIEAQSVGITNEMAGIQNELSAVEAGDGKTGNDAVRGELGRRLERLVVRGEALAPYVQRFAERRRAIEAQIEAHLALIRSRAAGIGASSEPETDENGSPSGTVDAVASAVSSLERKLDEVVKAIRDNGDGG